jgi:hypothetical protein
MEKNFQLKKIQKGMKSPKKKTAEKNKKTKNKQKKNTPRGAGRSIFGVK